MATVDTKTIIDELIKNDGYYPNPINDESPPDPRVALIVEYTNFEGRITWGITYVVESLERQRRYLIETPYVRKPRILWEAK